MKNVFSASSVISPLCLCCLFVVSACGKPSAANIELRKQNQKLRDEVATLQRQHQADAAALRGKEQGTSTAPIEKLFTVHGLAFGRLTGGADLDEKKPGHEGIKVYITPTDAAGEKIKAAGSFIVEAFDLARSGEQRIGRWEYPIDDAHKNWFGGALLDTYILTGLWQTPPQHPELTLKVTYTDGFTGRVFNAQKTVSVQLPSK